ncbi:MAG: COX15/CtaA family protein [Candidatus Andeanibacterium colombiense]|uniref:Heme A synthase n=1 Tax=Candidatus Andeanibacterium colombiense TaxID=3121345 RepID=A0AAJ6BNK8_9SPHN|nr:MAG: COX15/CtaA family protein [Sphingomonadaceae bacterium]
MNDTANRTIDTSRPLAVARWLLVVAALVILMVVVGGITRLTESGLSITRWEPVSGAIPPLSEAQWQTEFAHYRQIDQYSAIHAGMTLSEFKGIFFWEFSHRLLGRLIGMAFFVPLVWFWLRRAIPAGYHWRLVALLALGGMQGVFGWLMVKSGLQPGMVEVAPGWLATHLLTALFTLACLVWTALDLIDVKADPRARPARLVALAAITGAVLAIQLLYGALMAGLRAGLVTDQWPLMNDAFFPGPSSAGESLRTALFADPAIVHFIHRWWAWAAVAALIVLARRVRKAGDRPASIAIHSAFGLQVLLGIVVVWTGVPIWLAALHQLVGALLVAATAWGAHSAGRRG